MRQGQKLPFLHPLNLSHHSASFTLAEYTDGRWTCMHVANVDGYVMIMYICTLPLVLIRYQKLELYNHFRLDERSHPPPKKNNNTSFLFKQDTLVVFLICYDYGK